MKCIPNITATIVAFLLCLVSDTQAAQQPSNGSKQTKSPSQQKMTAKQKAKKALLETPTWTEATTAAKESTAFAFLGEYLDGERAIQVVPAEGRFYLSIYQGGLPGAGWDGTKIEHEWIEANEIQSRLDGLNKVDRSSNLKFAQPPTDATVLFDGSDTKQWAHGKMKDGLLQAGAKTKKSDYQDFQLHFETLIPFKPELPLGHPARGNSGVFALGAYEVQVCDSFGVDFAPDRWKVDNVKKKPNTWCGSVYGIHPADVNMCLPPLVWQTFDIEFTAARFEGDKKVADARMTVHHNGVKIHDNVAVTSGTGGGPKGPRPEVPSGPIYFQNHNNPTQYRNIWVIER